MKRLSDLKVKIFGDGADKAAILDLYAKPHIQGFTTNPTLMRKAGIRDYEAFAGAGFSFAAASARTREALNCGSALNRSAIRVKRSRSPSE